MPGLPFTEFNIAQEINPQPMAQATMRHHYANG